MPRRDVLIIAAASLLVGAWLGYVSALVFLTRY